VNLSYNISGHLSDYLSKIEKLRSEILLTPLSPKNETRLRWDANLEKTVWELSLNDIIVSKSDAGKTLSSSLTPKKRLSREEADILSLRNVFSYIRENWLANPQPVSLSVIKKIYDLACRATMGPMSGLTEYSEKRINALLSYLQKGQDHPAIQAGLVQAEMINITPFDDGNTRVARLLSYLYLYKGGYDIRGLLNLTEFYKRDVITYKRMLEVAKIQGNTTLFLEYFSFGMAQSLEKVLERVRNPDFSDNIKASFWKLNPRQQKIMEALENPEEKITNKDVQKLSGVSQITASRDLSHLTNLGLLLAHGKGRSVFYTRA
jgi:DNA-binding transcriptional ArsR family regulator